MWHASTCNPLKKRPNYKSGNNQEGKQEKTTNKKANKFERKKQDSKQVKKQQAVKQPDDELDWINWIKDFHCEQNSTMQCVGFGVEPNLSRL